MAAFVPKFSSPFNNQSNYFVRGRRLRPFQSFLLGVSFTIACCRIDRKSEQVLSNRYKALQDAEKVRTSHPCPPSSRSANISFLSIRLPVVSSRHFIAARRMAMDTPDLLLPVFPNPRDHRKIPHSLTSLFVKFFMNMYTDDHIRGSRTLVFAWAGQHKSIQLTILYQLDSNEK